MKRGRRARVRRAGCGLAAALLLAGCGYRAGLVAPAGANSIGVEVFANDGNVRDLEVELTRLVARELTDRVALPLSSPGDADVVVRGTIGSYRRRGGIRSPDNELLERELYVDVTASLVRRSTGAVLASTRRGRWTGFVEDFFVGEDDARQRVLESLAQALVLDLLGRRPTAPAPGDEPPGAGELEPAVGPAESESDG